MAPLEKSSLNVGVTFGGDPARAGPSPGGYGSSLVLPKMWRNGPRWWVAPEMGLVIEVRHVFCFFHHIFLRGGRKIGFLFGHVVVHGSMIKGCFQSLERPRNPFVPPLHAGPRAIVHNQIALGRSTLL